MHVPTHSPDRDATLEGFALGLQELPRTGRQPRAGSGQQDSVFDQLPFIPTGADEDFASPMREPASWRITASRLMALAARWDRVCPTPEAWRRVYMALPTHSDGRRLPRPPRPIDRRSWDATPEFVRRMRLREQVAWAEDTGLLGIMHALLSGLAEDEWHHLDHLKWPAIERGALH